MDGTDARGAAARHAFLFRLVEDLRRGEERTLADYQADFPGFETIVAEAHAHVRADATAASPGSGNDERAIGRFRIRRELGRGGQGTVFLAHDPELKRDVALKLLAPRFALDPTSLERFRREAGAASRLDHPGICAVHEIDETGGLPYIVMAYVPGESLASRLRRTEHPPSRESEVFRVLEYVERAARAAHVAHEAGIVHRDLKPGNLMVSRQGEPVILDFGLAHDEERSVSLTLSDDVFGTPAYMAPEQIDDSRRADRRTDVYALGVLLFESLTLRRPFQAPTREGLYHAIVFQEPPDPRGFNPHVTKDVRAILEMCLAKEPEHRYATVAELADDLGRVRRHEPVRARPAGVVLRLRRWLRRDPELAWTLIGVVVVLTVGLALTNTLAVRAARSLAEEQRLADLRTFAYLRTQAEEELWPVLPQSLEPMEAWLGEAHALVARSNLPAEEGRTMAGLRQDVRRRREEASELTRSSIGAHRPAWEAAIAAIADAEENPRYAGLVIEPQVGLVPLGQDPDSGLFEFAHLQTGEPPRRDPHSGRFVISEETGLVFVLIPPGDFCMGQLRLWDEPGNQLMGHTNYTTEPEHWLQLDAFFLSKYEMTQAQWLRSAGSNPSRHAPENHEDHPITYREPVGNVSWHDCVATLRRLGLVLPTEAQWEYAARAGTRTRYWTGESPLSLRGAANVPDRSVIRAGRRFTDCADFPDYDDDYSCTSPVGQFRPNAFGLHDVHGNVWEFVRDVWGSYENNVRAGDCERIVPESGKRILRGGSFVEGKTSNQVFHRYSMKPELRFSTQGLRPARKIWSSGATTEP